MGKLLKIILFLLAFSVFYGCTSKSQILMNSDGKTVRCYSYGHGGVGVIMAGKIINNCIEDYKKTGFIEIERAGFIGVKFNTDEPPVIIKVVTGSPAANAGILPGDILLSVNNQKIKKKEEIRPIIFGTIGTPVSIEIMRDGRNIRHNLYLSHVEPF